MNNRHSIKTLILSSALALGFGLTARADDPLPTNPPAQMTGQQGLLGQVYGTLSYSYINLDDTSLHADNYSLSVNQPMAFGLDGILSYDFSTLGESAGSRVRQHALGAALRAFSTSHNWGKPYAEAGIGYASARYADIDDNSFVWHVAGGIEFQVAPATTVTPYVQYVDAPDLAGDGDWNFGAKVNHWVNSEWAVTVGVEIDNHENTAFTIGTNFRY